jgi:hypothetical protein
MLARQSGTNDLKRGLEQRNGVRKLDYIVAFDLKTIIAVSRNGATLLYARTDERCCRIVAALGPQFPALISDPQREAWR